MAGKKPGKGMAIIIGMGKPMKAPKSAKGGKKMPPMPKGKGTGQKGMNY